MPTKIDSKPAEWWSLQKFGHLRIKHPSSLRKLDTRKREFVCDCGKSVFARVNEVVKGQILDCGRCDLMGVDWWTTQKFGKLRLQNPSDLSVKSRRKLKFQCDCGNTASLPVYKVVSGKCIACGSCKPSKRTKKTVPNWTKTEIAARLDELKRIQQTGPIGIQSRIDELQSLHLRAYEDVMSAAISSHRVMCEVKNMESDEAFGSNPFIYYSLGLVGEAGELSGAVMRAMRNGATVDGLKAAVESEIADCFIYTAILAHSTGIDLVKLVNEKARIVETRAKSGYYGGPLR